MIETIGVADAKRRFSELLERVARGERFLVARHGRPAVALVPPGEARETSGPPIGLAAFAGALAEWPEFDGVVSDIHASRRKAKDRPAPALE